MVGVGADGASLRPVCVSVRCPPKLDLVGGGVGAISTSPSCRQVLGGEGRPADRVFLAGSAVDEEALLVVRDICVIVGWASPVVCDRGAVDVEAVLSERDGCSRCERGKLRVMVDGLGRQRCRISRRVSINNIQRRHCRESRCLSVTY